jgi:hypothetical protein
MDTAKAVLRGKFIAMSAYIKRTERSQINDLMLHLKLRKTRTSKTQNKQKERDKIRNEVSELETKKTKNIQRIKETKCSSLKK